MKETKVRFTLDLARITIYNTRKTQLAKIRTGEYFSKETAAAVQPPLWYFAPRSLSRRYDSAFTAPFELPQLLLLPPLAMVFHSVMGTAEEVAAAAVFAESEKELISRESHNFDARNEEVRSFGV